MKPILLLYFFSAFTLFENRVEVYQHKSHDCYLLAVHLAQQREFFDFFAARIVFHRSAVVFAAISK